MPNERLRSAMTAAGHTARSLAEAVATDPKTVERWVNTGQLPHRGNALAAARVLGEDVASLWPLLKSGTGNGPAVREELVAVYARRAAV